MCACARALSPAKTDQAECAKKRSSARTSKNCAMQKVSMNDKSTSHKPPLKHTWGGAGDRIAEFVYPIACGPLAPAPRTSSNICFFLRCPHFAAFLPRHVQMAATSAAVGTSMQPNAIESIERVPANDAVIRTRLSDFAISVPQSNQTNFTQSKTGCVRADVW